MKYFLLPFFSLDIASRYPTLWTEQVKSRQNKTNKSSGKKLMLSILCKAPVKTCMNHFNNHHASMLVV